MATMTMYAVVLIALLCGTTTTSVEAMYSSKSSVVEVTTQKKFDSLVLDSEGLTMVKFYAEWCGHCKNLTPEFEKAADQLKGVVNFIAVNADDHRDIAAPYGIQGFPTLKIFKGKRDSSPKDYTGGRTASAIVDTMLSEVKSFVNGSTGKKSGGSGGGSSGGSNKKGNSQPGGGKHVETLTGSNFASKTSKSGDVWAVEFYAPWCGHCQQLAPVWASAAEEMKGMIKFGAMDCDVAENRGVCGKFNVESFPTIYAVQNGEPLKQYNGARDSESIATWAKELGEKYGPLPDVHQLYNKASFDEGCVGKSLCIIGFLQDIMDTGAEGRNKYITMMQEAHKKFFSYGWGWLWTEVGSQRELEDTLGVTDYPAVAAISIKKKRSAIMKGAFSFAEMTDFGRGLSSGRIKTIETPKDFPELIVDKTKWDGKDSDMVLEEEFSLDELMND